MANKQVLCVETGRVFDSVNMAAEFTLCAPQNISAAARGVVPRAGGYSWKYVSQEVKKPKKPDKPRSRPSMTIEDVQKEAERRTRETGRLVRYKHIQIEETLALIRERDRLAKAKLDKLKKGAKR